jgi:hypothetical protein
MKNKGFINLSLSVIIAIVVVAILITVLSSTIRHKATPERAFESGECVYHILDTDQEVEGVVLDHRHLYYVEDIAVRFEMGKEFEYYSPSELKRCDRVNGTISVN